MNYNQMFELVLNVLRQKGELTDLEKDIISTIEKYFDRPFDKEGAKQKIYENNCKNPELLPAFRVTTGAMAKPIVDLTDEELLNNLGMQIQGMLLKAGWDMSQR